MALTFSPPLVIFIQPMTIADDLIGTVFVIDLHTPIDVCGLHYMNFRLHGVCSAQTARGRELPAAEALLNLKWTVRILIQPE